MRRLLNTVVILAASAVAANAQPEDVLFKAMSLIASGSGMEEALPPQLQDGNYLDIQNLPSGALGNVLSPGPGGCSIVQTTATQGKGEFAQISVKSYDFTKIIGVRFLGPKDDFATAASRQPDDPAIDSISLDGKSWQCQRVIHIDPAKPYFAQFCEDRWLVSVFGEADKRAAREAIDLILAQCTPK